MGACAVYVFYVFAVFFAVAKLLQHLLLLLGEVVAVDKCVALRVVGWVDIDEFDLPKVALPQQAQRVYVVALQ